MRSMTGFGAGAVALRSGRITVEIRSLNHRFLELRVRLPSELSEQTFFVEQLCRTRMSRGRYDVSVRIEGNALPAPQLDLARAREALRSLCQLRDEFAPSAEVPLSALASLPDLMSSPTDQDPAEVREALQQSLEGALTQLGEMRSQEGHALQAEMASRLSQCLEICQGLDAALPRLMAAHEARLQQRMARLTSDASGLDERRLAMEVALLAERSDVEEELARLRSHFGQFDSFLHSNEPSGRKLDFLLQEMAREANTISAKCQDIELSKDIISLKAQLERLREQVQNVE